MWTTLHNVHTSRTIRWDQLFVLTLKVAFPLSSVIKVSLIGVFWLVRYTLVCGTGLLLASTTLTWKKALNNITEIVSMTPKIRVLAPTKQVFYVDLKQLAYLFWIGVAVLGWRRGLLMILEGTLLHIPDLKETSCLFFVAGFLVKFPFQVSLLLLSFFWLTPAWCPLFRCSQCYCPLTADPHHGVSLSCWVAKYYCRLIGDPHWVVPFLGVSKYWIKK